MINENCMTNSKEKNVCISNNKIREMQINIFKKNVLAVLMLKAFRFSRDVKESSVCYYLNDMS